MKQTFFILILLSGMRCNFIAQIKTSDSLQRVISNAGSDTIKIRALLALGEFLYHSEPDSALLTWKRATAIAESRLSKVSASDHAYFFYQKTNALLINNIGFYFQARGEARKAIEYFERSLSIFNKLNDKTNVAMVLNNLGYVHFNQGNVSMALECFGKSLNLREAEGHMAGIAESLNNMAYIFLNQGDLHKALEYNMRALGMEEKIGDKEGIAASLNNIGLILDEQGETQEALDHYQRSLAIREELGDKAGAAGSLINIGTIFLSQKDYSGGLEYFNRGLKLQEEVGDKRSMCTSLNNIGFVYLRTGDRAKALEYANRCMKTAMETGFPDNIREAANALYTMHKAGGNYKPALENYELFVKMRDSINNESTRKASIRSQLKYEYEKQAAADSVAHAKESEIKSAELSRQSAELKAKKNQQYALFGGLALVMIFAGFMYNRFKVTQRQKLVIEEQKVEVEDQKKLVEEKQKEVIDSIQYARRIQMAQIPSEKRVEGMLQKVKAPKRN